MSYDDHGCPREQTLMDISFTTSTDVPDFHLVELATPTDRNPLGVKGIGESAIIGSTPAVQNAVIDALAHLGITHIDMPPTPLRVWQAMQHASKAV